MPNTDENVDNHIAVCKKLTDIYAKKNKDYGNSFSLQFEKHGMLTSYIRLEDKMLRIEQLMENEAKVKNESIEDSLLDLANYAIMTLMELRKQ